MLLALLCTRCSHRLRRRGLIATKRALHSAPRLADPRIGDIGRLIKDDYAKIRETYEKPKHAIVLAHGLLGFDELQLVGSILPGIQYWRGIKEAFNANGIEVMTATVPAAGSIEARAEKLGESILKSAKGKSVNIIAGIVLVAMKTYTNAEHYSGLDARYMISRLRPAEVDVRSLTTIATPHQGSAFADHLFKQIGPLNVPKLYKVLEQFGLETGAFSQLTMNYMRHEFNPKTPDVDGIRYFSYGASLEPTFWSVFRPSFSIIKQIEGAPNDGLVSVPSSQWGEYKGTIENVSHLDLINWSNRFKWFLWELTGGQRSFNAIAFYLAITDMLAKEGL